MSGNNGQRRREERDRLLDNRRPDRAALAGSILMKQLSTMQANVEHLGSTINAVIAAQNRQAVATLVLKELVVSKGLITLEELNSLIGARSAEMLTPDGDVVVPAEKTEAEPKKEPDEPAVN